MIRRGRPMAAVTAAVLALLVCSALPGGGLSGQETPTLRLAGPDGTVRRVSLVNHRGYRALPLSALAGLGWAGSGASGHWRVLHGGEAEIRLQEGSPFFQWNGELLQMVDEPYLFGEELHVPVQLVTDFFPARLPEAYVLQAPADGALELRVLDPGHWPDPAAVAAAAERSPPPAFGAGEARDDPSTPAAGPGVKRVVVIDPGHGGRDPGAMGPGGAREKDVALAMGRALAEELRRYPDLEVHVTRDSDVLVPLWQRGQWATDRKGERPGVFISLHANALPSNRGARGFETYFLSDARTEHERRVAALENASLAFDGEEATGDDSEMGFILQELRNLDHPHWSGLLAELIQDQVGAVHPGPNRGVKQGPFAVITNALMPAVLVELGFISNREEERLLQRSSFHREAAAALARAVVDFFRRYPPGQGTTLEPAEPHAP